MMMTTTDAIFPAPQLSIPAPLPFLWLRVLVNFAAVGVVLAVARPASAQEVVEPVSALEPAPAAAPAEEPEFATRPDPLARSPGSVLEVYADSERRERFAEATVGVASAGGMLGLGFVADGGDMTLSHWLWATSAVVGTASLVHYFVPGELERLSRRSSTMSDELVLADWKKLARQARTERYVGGVFGTLIGIAGITTGALVFSNDIASGLTDTERGALGLALVAGGAGGIGGAIYNFAVPTPTERGYMLAAGPFASRMNLSAAPLPGGAAVSLSGRF